MNEPNKSSGLENPDPGLRRRLLQSRFGVLFVAIIFAIVSALSIVGFLFNLASNYPGTNRPVIAVDPLWMVGHVIRGIGLGALTVYLWRYRAAIKQWGGASDGEGTEQFIRAQAAAWTAGAVVLALLVVYALSYMMFAPRRV